MGRGNRRGGKTHYLDERLANNPSQPQREERKEEFITESSSSFPSTSNQQQRLCRAQYPKTHRNLMWVSRNRASKQRLIDNSKLNPDVSSQISEERTCSNAKEAGLNSEIGSDIKITEVNVHGSDIQENECRNKGYEAEDEMNDVGSLLKKLRLGDEEPELSEEQLMINDQLQEDELLALESIYGDNVFILEKQGGLRSFQIHIHVEVPGELTVTAKFNSLGSQKVECESDYSYSFRVCYLPPIVLACLLPKSYPSHLQPYFTLSVQWLDSIRISNLCSKMVKIWREQTGVEVIYQWVEWLQTSSLSYLGADQELTLGPYGIKHSEDMHAVSGIVSPDIDIPSLKSYNDQHCHEIFLQNMHECLICYNEYVGSDFIRLPCQHYFCRICMKTFAEMHITEGTVNKLQCPDAKCGGMVPPDLLKRLLGDEEYERWESLMLQKTLDSMSDVVYCPRCETPCLEDDGHDAQCSKCYFSFCTLCRERRHVGEECLTPELKLRILEERQNSSQLKDKQKIREREMINELLSLKEIHRDAKQCPSCKMAISRTEGCNKMVCNNCGRYFCYNVTKLLMDMIISGCQLFPQQEIEQWEWQMNARQIVAQARVELFADRAHSCPNCGQINAKVGNNNHIYCWACQQHYCYLCKKIVRRSAEHFRPKGCKQHTPG